MRIRTSTATFTALAALAAGALSVAPAAAEPNDSQQLDVTAADVTELLPDEELAKWNALTDSEKEESLEILSDPDFLTPAFDASEHPEAKVLIEETPATPVAASKTSVDGDVQLMATKTRAVTQNWTILGVSYAEASTRITFVGSASTGVTSIQNCWSNVVNYVPLRTINWNNYSGKTGANAPSAYCKSDMSIARVGQATQYGMQGLLVNGGGTIVTRWYL